MIKTTFVGGVSPFQPRIEIEKSGKKKDKRIGRIKKPTVQRCDHITKEEILAFVHAAPGCTRAQIGAAFDRTSTSVNKHMKVLIKTGVITQVLARPDPRIRQASFHYFAVQ